MNNETRFIFREETFNDLAVRELAKSRSMCICRIQFGSCKKDECTNCSIGNNYRHCYNMMSDYDKSRLAQCVSSYYATDSLTPAKWMSYTALKMYAIKWIVIGIVCLLALILPLFFAAPSAEPTKHSEQPLTIISNIIREVQSNVTDLDGDGKVNCIDYTCCFKMLWDYKYPNSKKECIIIRNKNLTYHHLFIGVYTKNALIFVEPWANNPEKFLMDDNWSNEFNPVYNIYGETEQWLSEVKR